MARIRRKKKHTHRPEVVDASAKREPRTFVFRKGRHAALLADLEADLRRMLLPNTADRLRETRRNTLKDFVAVAGPLGVSHFVMLSTTDAGSYLRVAAAPRGPTLTLRIKSYALAREVAASQARPRVPPNAFKSPPLLVMNGFGSEPHMRLATSLWQHMLPPIRVSSVKLSTCQRVVLLNADKDTGVISLRHYTISVAPSGLRKSIKALVHGRAAPDLGALQDVSDFVTRSGYGSESEGEDADAARVTLAQGLGRGNAAARQSRIRLHEAGPRLELEVVKAEAGLCDGQVLWHAHVSKTPEEAASQQAGKDAKAREKSARRRQQEENVRRKEREATLKKATAAAERAHAAGQPPPGAKPMWWEEGADGAAEREDDDDDDAEYFRQEVGREPDEEERLGARTSFGRGRGGRGGRRGGRGGGRGRGGGGRGSSGGRHGASGFGGRSMGEDGYGSRARGGPAAGSRGKWQRRGS